MIQSARLYTPPTDSLENPIGTDGFECIEFAATDPSQLQKLFDTLGFTPVARHKQQNIILYRQGEINFLINGEPGSFASQYISEHGPSTCAMGFRVKDAKLAYQRLIDRGAAPYIKDNTPFHAPTVYGADGGLIYLLDNYEDHQIYKENFEPLSIQTTSQTGLTKLDHITINQGNRDAWTEYYSKLFNFREQGQNSILTSPCDKIRIHVGKCPEEQWQIALGAEDIDKSIKTLKGAGVDFIDAHDESPYTTKPLLGKISFEIK